MALRNKKRRMSKRLYSTQTAWPWSRLQICLYMYLCGVVLTAVFFLVYRFLFQVNDAMWVFSVLLMLTLFILFYMASLPFKKIKVVDFYADHLEIRAWNFWNGRGREILGYAAYSELVSVQCLEMQRVVMGLSFHQSPPLRLRFDTRLYAFLQQKLLSCTAKPLD